jgi:hypothetical protein
MFYWIPSKYLALRQVSLEFNWPTNVTDGKGEEPSKGKVWNINANIVALLAFWYSHQEVSVRGRNIISDSFSIKNGTRQGGILLPVLFTKYIRELLQAIVDTRI